MKHFFKTIILLIVTTFMLLACSSNDEDNIIEETNFMSAKIEGQDFFTDFPIYLAPTEQIITVSGQNEENTVNIQISIFNYNGPGTYAIDTNNQNENIISIIENGTVWLTDKDNGSGTVTFTEEGNFLKGTFTFIALNSSQEAINISEGKFKVQYQF